MARHRPSKPAWDATSVRGLRRALDLTQQQLAEALGVRQQTVSEWETGMYRPRGASARMLSVIADRGDDGQQGGYAARPPRPEEDAP